MPTFRKVFAEVRLCVMRGPRRRSAQRCRQAAQAETVAEEAAEAEAQPTAPDADAAVEKARQRLRAVLVRREASMRLHSACFSGSSAATTAAASAAVAGFCVRCPNALLCGAQAT